MIGDRKKYAKRIKENMAKLRAELEEKIKTVDRKRIEFDLKYVEPPKVVPEVDEYDTASDSSYSHIKGIV